MIAVDNAKENGLTSIEKVCNCMHLHRDAYYKSKDRLQQRKSEEAKVISLVKKERNIQPRVGTRKLYEGLRETFRKSGIKIGRDRLFNILRGNDMLVNRKRPASKPPTLIIIFTNTTTL